MSKVDQAWLDGYIYVVKIIEACVRERSHANPIVARVLNEAFSALASELRSAIPNLKEPKCPPSPNTNPTTSSSSS